MKEIWILINNWDNYAVSNTGKVKNVRTGKEIKQVENSSGYLTVGLCQNEKKANFRVHRLVALTFIPNPKNKEDVNHIDGNKKNNHVDNLEWNTRKENDNHARKMGLKHDNKPVKITDLENGETYVFFSISEGARYLNLNKGILSRALKQRNGKYKNYQIEYV